MVDANLHQHADATFRKSGEQAHMSFLTWLLNFDGGGRRPLLFAFGLCVGAAWYGVTWHEPALWPLLGACLTSLALVAGLTGRRLVPPVAATLAFIMLAISVGALAGKLATYRVQHPVIAGPLGPVMVEGWVEEVEPASRGVRLRLIVHAIDDLARHELPDRVRVTHTTRLQVEAGRFVRCWAVLRPPPGPLVPGDYAFDRQAYYEGLGAVGYVQGRCRGGALGAPISWLDQFRLWIAKHRRNLGHFVNRAGGERAGGFAAALASGDRSFMADRDQEALRGSGLAHLLAISGLHMGIVGGMVYLIIWRGLALIEPIALRIPVQKPAALAALFASLCYLLLSGASISTQRAFIMAAVLFGAVLFDRVALSLRSLAIAMIMVVLVSPWSVVTPGFQMSFAATGALIATYEAWQRHDRERAGPPRRGVSFWLKSLFVTSLVSGLATMPFALYHFDRVAAFGLGANLLAMPIISLLAAPLAALALIAAPFGLSEWPLAMFGKALEAVLWVAHTFSDLGPQGAGFARPMPAASLVMFTIAMALGAVWRGWPKRLASAGLFSLAGLGLWLVTPPARLHWAPSGEVFLVHQAGQVERIDFISGDGLAPLRYVDAPVSAHCQGAICQRTLAGQSIALVPAGVATTCQQLRRHALVLIGDARPELAACPTRLHVWGDLPTRGLSWQFNRREGPTEIQRPPCGERPWYPCVRAD